MNPKGGSAERVLPLLMAMAGIGGISLDDLIEKTVEPKCDDCGNLAGSVRDLFPVQGKFICGGCVLDRAAKVSGDEEASDVQF